MSNTYVRRRIADLNKVRQNNIVYTDLNNELSESIFKEEFQKTARVINNIIKFNETESSNKTTPVDIVRREYQTAVPFIGSRGTGKTSVMYSVLRYLENYPCEDRKQSFLLDVSDEIRFITFDMIDAGNLKKTEDMMEIILSRMLSYLEDRNDEPAFRSQNGELRIIYQEIEDLYRSMDKVFWQKSDARDTTNLRGLKKIADSQDAVDNFQVLVADFAKFVSHTMYRGKPCYLVFALDDVDLYQGSCRGMQDEPFTLLEYIYSFMRIPGLIVLMTYNEHILKRKCNNHFATEHLYGRANKRFRDLCMVPLVRQDRLLIDEILLHRSQIAKSKDSLGYADGESPRRWKYSYGELLHNLYFATRIAEEPGSKESFFPKQLVHCILAAHSTQLNQIMQLPNARTMLLEVIGFSIAGRWANEMLPSFFFTDGAGRMSMNQLGSVSIPLKYFFNFKLPTKVQSELCSAKNNAKGKNYLYYFLDALFILGMFFSHFPANGLGIVIEADQGEDGEPALYLRSRSEENVCFNVWNFSVNSYRALPCQETGDEGYLAYIRNKLEKLIDEFTNTFVHRNIPQENTQPPEELELGEEFRSIMSPIVVDRLAAEKEKLSADIKRQNAWKDFAKKLKNKDKSSFKESWKTALEKIYDTYKTEAKNWEEENPDRYLVLPIQHFDMMYNIIKRLASNSYHDIPEEANINELYDYYVLLYKNMDSELKSQDCTYFKNGENGFAYAFTSSRFYRIVTAQKGTEDYNPILRPLLDAMMQSVAASRRAGTAESNPFRL